MTARFFLAAALLLTACSDPKREYMDAAVAGKAGLDESLRPESYELYGKPDEPCAKVRLKLAVGVPASGEVCCDLATKKCRSMW